MKELIGFFFVGFEGFCVCDNIGFDKLGFTVKRNAGSGSGFENHGQVVWPCWRGEVILREK